MLMLLFSLNNERYALKSQQVIEVSPLVELKKQPHAPSYVSGVFNYRGKIVPVIDLCQLIQGKPCRAHLSTRIVLVNYWSHVRDENAVASSNGRDQRRSEGLTHSPCILGLMAEQVVETLNRVETDWVDARIRVETAPYLGKIILDAQGMIQRIHPENLLTEEQRFALCTTPQEPLRFATHDAVGS